MRILQVTSDTDRRGAQVFALDLEAALAARGHHLETIALVPGFTGGLGVEALGAPGAHWWSVGVLRPLRERMAQFDVTLAHGSSTGPACAVAGLGPGRPFVYRQISDSRYWAPTRAKRVRVRATLAVAHSVVALSEFNRTELIQWIGVPPSHVTVIPNGVPTRRFSPATPPERAAARVALGLPDALEVPVVAFVGALVPEKGADVAVRAMGRFDDAHLVVAGAGCEADRLERLATDVAPGRVHFVGTTADVLRVYHAADLIVLPSRAGDAMPAVVIEAGLCGLPAVTTAVGAIPEVVRDGDTGYVVAPGDLEGIIEPIGRLLGDPVKRSMMGDAAREHCRAQYDIRRVAESWEAALQAATARA